MHIANSTHDQTTGRTEPWSTGLANSGDPLPCAAARKRFRRSSRAQPFLAARSRSNGPKQIQPKSTQANNGQRQPLLQKNPCSFQ